MSGLIYHVKIEHCVSLPTVSMGVRLPVNKCMFMTPGSRDSFVASRFASRVDPVLGEYQEVY